MIDEQEPLITTTHGDEDLADLALSVASGSTSEPMAEATGSTATRGATVEDRMGYLGGSDAGIIVGVSKWKTPYELYLEKCGEAEPADLSEVERVQMGADLEDFIARKYTEKTGNRVRRVNRAYFHKTMPWLGGHVDRIVENTDRLLECKNVDGLFAKEWVDGVPDKYIPQVQHYLGVTGRIACDVVALIGGNHIVIHTVDRDDEFIAALFEVETAFWQGVLTGTPPDPLTSAESSLRWAKFTPGAIEASADTIDAIGQLVAIREEKAAIEAIEDSLEIRVKAGFGESCDVLMSGSRVLATWKGQTTTRVDTKALRAKYPEIAEELEKPSTCRKLLVKA